MGAALRGLTVEALAREWMDFLSMQCQQIEQKTEDGTGKATYPWPKSRFRKERQGYEGAREGADREFQRQLYYFSTIVIKGGNTYVSTDGFS